MGILVTASLKMIMRDYQAVFWALAFPLIFLGVFRLFSFDASGTSELIISTDDQSPRGAAVIEALSTVEFLDVSVEAGIDEPRALERLEAGEAHLVLIVGDAPARETASATLLHRIDDPIGSSVTVAAIESVIAEVNLELSGVPRAIEMATRSAEIEDTTFFQFVAPGIIGMGLMTFATINLATSLSRYREEGVLRRIQATPLPPWRFFSSVVIAHLVMAFAQVVVLVIAAEALGAHVLRGGIGLVAIAVLGTLIFLNLGVIIAGRVRGRGGVEGAANAVTLPMMFLAGTFFPTEALPGAMQPLVQLLPLTHMLDALRGVTLDSESIAAQGISLLAMAAWVAVSFVGARFAFSFRDT